MRRILVESLRRKQSLKRGGDLSREAFDDELGFDLGQDLDELLDLNDAIDQLSKESPQIAELVKLRLFGGLPLAQAGEMLGFPSSTAHVHWRYASAWLERRVKSA
jgi:RNA polymerase sigma factor (TIGR02999 family)